MRARRVVFALLALLAIAVLARPVWDALVELLRRALRTHGWATPGTLATS
jgi:hypothetical protein